VAWSVSAEDVFKLMDTGRDPGELVGPVLLDHKVSPLEALAIATPLLSGEAARRYRWFDTRCLWEFISLADRFSDGERESWLVDQAGVVLGSTLDKLGALLREIAAEISKAEPAGTGVVITEPVSGALSATVRAMVAQRVAELREENPTGHVIPDIIERLLQHGRLGWQKLGDLVMRKPSETRLATVKRNVKRAREALVGLPVKIRSETARNGLEFWFTEVPGSSGSG
jgi:hypothetical protein